MYLRLNMERDKLFMLLHLLVLILGLLGTGYSSGYSAIVLPVLTSNITSITLSETEIPLFASIVYLGQIIGSLCALVTMRFQRRYGMMICSMTNILGWVMIASSYSVTQLFIGRIITGSCTGMSSSCFGIYMVEIMLPEWKEPVTVLITLCFTCGIMLVYILGYIIQNDWRLVATLCIISPILSLFCVYFFSPESPFFLVMKGQKEAAKFALLRLRGLQGRPQTAKFQKEFDEIVRCCEEKNNDESPKEEISSFVLRIRNKLNNFIKAACLPEVWKPVMITSIYIFFQQFCGVYVIVSYAVNIIITINITIDPFLITVFIGIAQVMFGCICIYCSTRIGRRPIAIISSTGMSIFMCGLTLYIQFLTDTDYMIIPLVCILGYMMFAAFGIMLLPAAIIPELCPGRYLPVIGPMICFLLYSAHFISVQLYPAMVRQNKLATMYFYCTMSVLATIFVTTMLPESRGKSHAQIEEEFRGKSSVESASETKNEAADGKSSSKHRFALV